MKWKQTLAIAAALILILAAGCSSKSSSEENGKLKVVTTYSILYDIVKQVGG
ncbi:metal ABC transporter substrate-binding protein, partial [Salmonella enterica subsp. enterica serovar Kentucky]|nr:metal ABC transporter substrate-binding protein [Salmonella enterica subsp. enterica serovar Kentucky]